MALDIFILALGFVLLIWGADWLVNSSLRLSFLFKLSPLFVALTFVAFGTSAPEAAVGIVAAVKNQKAIALGNIIGSNIANLLNINTHYYPPVIMPN